MAKLSIRKALRRKRERKTLDPQFRDLILSFDAEYKPRRSEAANSEQPTPEPDAKRERDQRAE